MSVRSLVVLGTGGHASVVIDLARLAGWAVIGCVGPEPPTSGGCAHLGGDEIIDRLDRGETALTIGVGSTGRPDLRRQLFATAQIKGFAFPSLVHPSATIAESASVGAGTQVMAGAIVQAYARIGRNVIVNTAALIEHHAEIGNHVHVAPRAVLCGGVKVGAGGHIGPNATVLQGLTIGEAAIVGAGAVVTRSVPTGVQVKGVPAR